MQSHKCVRQQLPDPSVELQQVWTDDHRNEEVLAMVVRTGTQTDVVLVAANLLHMLVASCSLLRLY